MSRTQNQNWPDAMVEELKRLWTEGVSASQIGRALGKTRNAVLGKTMRLGLASRAPAPREREKIDKKRKRQHGGKRFVARKTAQPLPKLVILAPQARTDGYFATLGDVRPNECRFPHGAVGPGGKLTVCGRKVLPGKPYCEAHCAIAYEPKPKKPRASRRTRARIERAFAEMFGGGGTW